jgi:hypothetical protein
VHSPTLTHHAAHLLRTQKGAKHGDQSHLSFGRSALLALGLAMRKALSAVCVSHPGAGICTVILAIMFCCLIFAVLNLPTKFYTCTEENLPVLLHVSRRKTIDT